MIEFQIGLFVVSFVAGIVAAAIWDERRKWKKQNETLETLGDYAR